MGPGFAVALGASRVVYADHDPLRLAIAERLGAERLALTSADDFRNVDSTFNVTVDASGEPAYLSALIHANRTCQRAYVRYGHAVPWRGCAVPRLRDVPLPSTSREEGAHHPYRQESPKVKQRSAVGATRQQPLRAYDSETQMLVTISGQSMNEWIECMTCCEGSYCGRRSLQSVWCFRQK